MSLEQKWVDIVFPEEQQDNEKPEWLEQQETLGRETTQELWQFKDLLQEPTHETVAHREKRTKMELLSPDEHPAVRIDLSAVEE